MCRLQPPSDGRSFFLVKGSISSLIKEYEGSRTVFKVFLAIFGGVGLAIVSRVAWKLYKKRWDGETAHLYSIPIEGWQTESLSQTRRGWRVSGQREGAGGQGASVVVMMKVSWSSGSIIPRGFLQVYGGDILKPYYNLSSTKPNVRFWPYSVKAI